MGRVPEAKLVIKHTFLEYVGDDSKESLYHSPRRLRSQTEPAIDDDIDYGEVREMMHGSDSCSSSSHIADMSTDVSDSPLLQPSSSAIMASVLATPEGTPRLYPMARQLPGWMQEEGAQNMLLPPATPPQALTEYCPWSESVPVYDWWNPPAFDLGVYSNGCEFSNMADYTQYQFGYDGAAHMYAPAASFEQSTCQATQTKEKNLLTEMGLLSPAPSMDSRSQFHVPPTQWDVSNLVGKEEAATGISESDAKETRTTVMLRDLPDAYSRSALLELLDTEGFFGRFDFFYLPVDFKHQRNLGYALINLVSPMEALRLTRHFNGFTNWNVTSDKVCSVSWCNPQQGLEAHVERYRNSPVMHESVPTDWQPMLLSHGVQVAFPEPTKKMKAPKVKGQRQM